MIRCNLCMRYSHCHCVALSDGYRGTFKCHACVDSVAKENDEDNETLFSVVEEIYVTLYEIICDYLVAGQKEAAFLTFQAQYISELLKVPEAHKTTTAKSLKKLYEFIEKSKSPGIYSSIDQYEIRTVCRALSAFRTPNSYRGMLELVLRLVLKSLTDPSSVVRTKAVRVLAVLVEANPPLLFQENIRSVLQARFRDKTISVREAAISLVGPFLLSYPDQTELYFPPILDRLQDSGVSVRNKVIKIFRDLYIAQPDSALAEVICVNLLKILPISEDAVVKTLLELWFSFSSLESESHKMNYARNTAKIIVKTLSTVKEEKSFTLLLNKVFEQEARLKTQHIRNVAELIVKAIMEMLLENTNSLSITQTDCMAALFYFCKSQAQLLCPFAELLRPYLCCQARKKIN
ncbi:uncharacterized protein LOC135145537 [Zophobas morio]|uniref:uncharacterized protein LOC135145537 n=1 Tax=Zophobas morio TaxID=2755281 RepID=UPI0030828D1F